MVQLLIIGAVVLLLCVASSKLLYRFGIPSLLIFLVLGMLFGSDGLVGIQFDNFALAQQVCSVGLIFIMFFGGFETNLKAARPVLLPSILMSTLGVVITALLTGLFCYFCFQRSFLESLLIGATVSSTDAASVFGILRSRKLNLKGGIASLLEVESGSNDPCSYMLTMIVLSFLTGGEKNIGLMLLSQVGLGLGLGFIFAKVAVLVLKRINLEVDGLYPLFTVGIVVLGYGLCESLGGNGYLCVYLIGILLGNSRILHKRSLIHFFNGISWLMQVMLFFVLGLLSFPSQLPAVIGPGILLSVFMILIARPAATFGILSFFRFPLKQKIFISWVGLRGAASIVFAISAVAMHVGLGNYIFHMIFFVSLFSVGVQGTFIPSFAKKLDLVEENESVLRTFNDYQEEGSMKLYEFTVEGNSRWADKTLMEAGIPEHILVVMIKRGQEVILPKGSTLLLAGDIVVLGQNLPEDEFMASIDHLRSS
ncbi:potassium/proton antiporter [Zongyangia hominis]|uniref:Potassium/proton antiporter n=1 Tax=Zongyangia hominis TaxID=2763677 RepID=A0A926EB99_9FIRM|nr:potassium/proton antiporter [Zongyangia hominis]MBC8569875.1 potassium/proton antiporter [Zongyangia hominis]